MAGEIKGILRIVDGTLHSDYVPPDKINVVGEIYIENIKHLVFGDTIKIYENGTTFLNLMLTDSQRKHNNPFAYLVYTPSTDSFKGTYTGMCGDAENEPLLIDRIMHPESIDEKERIQFKLD